MRSVGCGCRAWNADATVFWFADFLKVAHTSALLAEVVMCWLGCGFPFDLGAAASDWVGLFLGIATSVP